MKRVAAAGLYIQNTPRTDISGLAFVNAASRGTAQCQRFRNSAEVHLLSIDTFQCHVKGK